MNHPIFMSVFQKRLFLFYLLSISIFSVFAKKVFMTGDSHVFSKIYPQEVKEILQSRYPDINFSWWAKNGICFYSFNSHRDYFDSIFSFQPDILIVHLGTNGAYTNNFSQSSFLLEMENFYNTLTDSIPDVKVVFVTPFTNKIRTRRKRGKWRINNNNRIAADIIISFSENHSDTYVIDHNAETGLKYIKSRSFIRPDNVHLTEKGYLDLGKSIGNEILGIESLWEKP